MTNPATKFEIIHRTARNMIASDGEDRAMGFIISTAMSMAHAYAAEHKQPFDAVLDDLSVTAQHVVDGTEQIDPAAWQAASAVLRRSHELRVPMWMDAGDVPLPDVAAILMAATNMLTYAMNGEEFWDVRA